MKPNFHDGPAQCDTVLCYISITQQKNTQNEKLTPFAATITVRILASGTHLKGFSEILQTK